MQPLKLRTVLVDDEPGAREALAALLQAYCPQAELVGQADGVQAGVELIKRTAPDLVVLDVELADGDGFGLLQHFAAVEFKIVFVTAHREYALRALKCSALDFLLKPVDPDELVAAVQKAEKALAQTTLQAQLQALLDNLASGEKEPKKLVLRTAESVYVVSSADIIRCEAAGNYTQFFLKNGNRLLISKTLKEYDELLQKSGFFRAHQSHLVNLQYLERYDKRDGGVVVLQDKSAVPVAGRQRERLFELLGA